MDETSTNPAVYISQKWWFLYETLCRGEDSVFSQMTGLFTLCASIGYNEQKRHELEKPKKDIFKWMTLNQETEIPVLTSITWEIMERNTAFLTDRKQIIEISQEFAEGGMQYLHDHFLKRFSQCHLKFLRSGLYFMSLGSKIRFPSN